MRGDGLRLGWRTLVGVVLVATLFLHGFDPSFSVDGYTMGVLGLLLVLALAGELEFARVAGIGIRFRRLALQRIESDLDDLPPPGQVDGPPEDEGDDGGGSCFGAVPATARGSAGGGASRTDGGRPFFLL